MEIKGESIILRDYIKTDIDDDIYWETVETEWKFWDSPWECEEREPFDPHKFREKKLKILGEKKDIKHIRRTFEICVSNKEKTHIGGCGSYDIDDNYHYTKGDGKYDIGIAICSIDAQRKGYATSALKIYIYYLMSKGIYEIYTQTWSGNYRMIGLAEKLGFEECNREKITQDVKGKYYDNLTFKLSIDNFIKKHPLVLNYKVSY